MTGDVAIWTKEALVSLKYLIALCFESLNPLLKFLDLGFLQYWILKILTSQPRYEPLLSDLGISV